MATNTTTINNLPTTFKVDEFTDIIQSAPNALSTNQKSVANCNNAGQALLDTIESLDGINSDELDAQVAAFIDKTKITLKKMNERRSPITQLLTRVSKEFTTLENDINPTTKDSTAYKLQEHRNKYVAKKLEQQKAIEAAERKRQAIEKEKSDYRVHLMSSLERHYNLHFNDLSGRLQQLFNTIDLNNFDLNSSQIASFSTIYDAQDHFSKFIDRSFPVNITDADKTAIKREVVPAMMQKCITNFATDIQVIKDDILLKLPSRKKELEQIEVLRKQNAEAAAQAEKLAKERQAQEHARLEAERIKREEEEKARLEALASQADIFSSFQQTAEAMPTTVAEAKVTKKIKVNNANGFLEIYQMWFLSEAPKMSLEELEKIHKRMITLCERKANRDDEFIKSAFVEYIDDIKAK